MALFSEELFCDHIHMIFGTAEQIMAAAPTVPEEKTKNVPKVVTALIARERNGQIISVKRAVSR
jgi:hypothetical protein